MAPLSPARRRFLTLWLAGGGVVLGGRLAAQSPARSPLPPTPACGDAPTPRQTEGPYYRPGSALRSNLRGDQAGGQAVALIGRVIDPSCRPLAGVTVDLWHADAAGGYDTQGFRFRGHQISDVEGRFAFETIHPGRYPGRTPHYHVMLYRNGRAALTTQLYFPGEAQNARDRLFDRRLVMKVNDAGRTTAARFDFVLAG